MNLFGVYDIIGLFLIDLKIIFFALVALVAEHMTAVPRKVGLTSV